MEDTETIIWYLLPDGTYAIVRQEMTYGDAIIILLLIALLFLEIYKLWTHHRFIR